MLIHHGSKELSVINAATLVYFNQLQSMIMKYISYVKLLLRF
jgi:positive regulator of sigma E activity